MIQEESEEILNELPPGQRAREDFPRFGLPKYADRMPDDPIFRGLNIGGDAVDAVTLDPTTFFTASRIEQTSDFHCVTTWSYLNARWSGFRFADLFERLLAPHLHPGASVRLVVFRCGDGYRTALPIDDVTADDVLLADRLANSPLSLEHGAPLRLVAPAHYGYKNAKHIVGIDLWTDEQAFRKPGLAHYMDHPRGRVALEERGRVAPGWLLRVLYRRLIEPTVRRCRVTPGE